ncbi:hypothetical protein CEXT_20691 [Caerostris extrusa]|uniref:Uncharacterized protein n=1 Tax=Caerostris extrusa TaxID=172846 RepID=A0AAV4WR78_CAEEX|nr:hypothetical protein CEXT_20691 [Caerostris extrusa]
MTHLKKEEPPTARYSCARNISQSESSHPQRLVPILAPKSKLFSCSSSKEFWKTDFLYWTQKRSTCFRPNFPNFDVQQVYHAALIAVQADRYL